MKVTLMDTMAGPGGVARRGWVLDLPEQKAKELLEARHARPYDETRDARAKVGLERPKDNEHQ